MKRGVLLYRADASRACARLVASYSELLEAQQEGEPLPHGDVLIIRWGSTYPLPDYPSLNSAVSVRLVKDKAAFRRHCGAVAVPVYRRGYEEFPCVVRPPRHSGGRRFFLCRTHQELRRAIRRCGPRYYASRYIANRQAEYRVFVVQGRVVHVVEREGEGEVWNYHQGGVAAMLSRAHWPLEACHIAAQAGRYLGWAAVDLIEDANGKPWVLEANAAPGIVKNRPAKRLARVFEAVVKLHPEMPPQVPASLRDVKSWKNLVHPALLKEEEN